MCVLSLRETDRFAPSRTVTRVVVDENGQDAWAAVVEHVSSDAFLVADEHKASDDLVGLVSMRRVNHSARFLAC
jgi:hypothetical protein